MSRTDTDDGGKHERMDLSGRVAIVTGASSGIGEATARRLAREGCAVTLAARRADRLERIAGEIGDRALAVPTDVTDEEDIARMVERTREEHGPVDLLVNNAGAVDFGPFVSTDREAIRRQVEVNLLGLLNVTHEVLPGMIESGGGDVVAVSSVNGEIPAEEASTYSGTKAGVNGFCHALRKEVAADGVRVMVVMPGGVDTEMAEFGHLENVLDPADVADTVAYAASRPDNALLAECIVAESPPLPYRRADQ